VSMHFGFESAVEPVVPAIRDQQPSLQALDTTTSLVSVRQSKSDSKMG